MEAHNIMSRNIYSLQHYQEIRELIDPFDYIRDMTIHLKVLEMVTPNMWFGQQVRVPWS